MFLSQVNGIDVQGLRHAQVVELIQAAGNEVRLLVVDPETDELYLNLGLMATASSPDKGQSSGGNVKNLVPCMEVLREGWQLV